MGDDDYPTCRQTFVTLRLYRDNDSPDGVSRLLELEPSSTQTKSAKWIRRGETYRRWLIKSNPPETTDSGAPDRRGTGEYGAIHLHLND